MENVIIANLIELLGVTGKKKRKPKKKKFHTLDGKESSSKPLKTKFHTPKVSTPNVSTPNASAPSKMFKSLEEKKATEKTVLGNYGKMSIKFDMKGSSSVQALTASAKNMNFILKPNKTPEEKKTLSTKIHGVVKSVIAKFSSKDKKELVKETKDLVATQGANPKQTAPGFISKHGGKIALVVGLVAGALLLGALVAVNPGLAMYAGIHLLEKAGGAHELFHPGGLFHDAWHGKKRPVNPDENTAPVFTPLDGAAPATPAATPAATNKSTAPKEGPEGDDEEDEAAEKTIHGIVEHGLNNQGLVKDLARKAMEGKIKDLKDASVPIKGSKTAKQEHWDGIRVKTEKLLEHHGLTEEQKEELKEHRSKAIRNIKDPSMQDQPYSRPKPNKPVAKNEEEEENEEGEEEGDEDDEEGDEGEEGEDEEKEEERKPRRKVKAAEYQGYEKVLSLLKMKYGKDGHTGNGYETDLDRFGPLYQSNPLVQPTYAALRLHPSSARMLNKWAIENGIKNVYPPGEIHITVCYSKDPIFFKSMKFMYGPEQVFPHKLGFLGRESNKKYVVLHLKKGGIADERFRQAMSQGASHDFPEYTPHISIAPPGHGMRDLSHIDVSSINFPLLIDYEYNDELKAS
jgi:hypothetical protein